MTGFSDSLSVQTEMSKAMQNYEIKVAKIETQSNDGVQVASPMIDYTEGPEVKSTIAQIDEIVG